MNAPTTTSSLPPTPEAVDVLTSEADLHAVLGRVRHQLGVDVATVLRVDRAAGHLVTVAMDSATRTTSGNHRVPIGRGVAGRVAAGRAPIALADMADDALVNPALLALGVQSVLAVPVMDASGLVGVLKVGSRAPRHFTAKDIARAETLAVAVAHAMRAIADADERSAASALQRSLVPSRFPDLPGLQLAGRYVPGWGGVSGDWYDVFTLPGGRIGMVMGDVAGHGLGASVVMGRLRSVLRAYALEHEDPAEVLRRLDAKIFHFEPGAIATAIYAVAEPPYDEIQIASAGHFPPVMLDDRGRAAPAEVPVSLPLGVDPTCERTTGTLRLPAGAALVMFTDGLVERRTTSTPLGEHVFGSIDNAVEQLCSLVEPEDAEVSCSRILDTMLTIEPPGDDVALLVVRRLG